MFYNDVPITCLCSLVMTSESLTSPSVNSAKMEGQNSLYQSGWFIPPHRTASDLGIYRERSLRVPSLASSPSQSKECYVLSILHTCRCTKGWCLIMPSVKQRNIDEPYHVESFIPWPIIPHYLKSDRDPFQQPRRLHHLHDYWKSLKGT